MLKENKNQLDLAFEELETEFGESRVIRKEMIENLRKTLANPEMTPSPYDKAMVMQAKVSIYKTLDDLLKSDEDVSIKKLKLKLSRKDSETNGMVGQTIVNLLKSMRCTGEMAEGKPAEVDRGAAVAELRELQEKNKKELEITPGELQECSTTPTSDGNAESVIEKEKEGEEE